MKVARMKAEQRTAIGRNQTRTIRKEGWLPAVLYGDKQGSQSISISEWEFEQHIKQHHKVYALDIDGARQDAYLQAMQFDPMTDRPLHVDFLRIDLNKPMEVEVEITLLGHPVGLGKGGALMRDEQSIRMRCLPTQIPEIFEVAIGHLDIGDALHASDLTLPEGVELAVPPETTICHVAVATQTTEAAAEAEAEAAGEGEGDGEGDGGGEPAKE